MAGESFVHITREGVDGRGLAPAPFDPADFESAPDSQSWALAKNDETLGLYVGVWTTAPMQEAFGPYPGDEFMLSLQGTTRLLDADGGETVVRPGQAFCVHNAWPVSWRQDDPMRKFFMICEDRNPPADPPTDPGVIVYQAGEPPASQASVEEGLFGAQTVLFASRSGVMTAGLASVPAHGPTPRTAEAHELLCVASGALSLAVDGGERRTIAAGEAVYIPSGLAFESVSDAGAELYSARCTRR